jgi:dolichyl-diphosphooligosaccharide--protein glycosyltransferase
MFRIEDAKGALVKLQPTFRIRPVLIFASLALILIIAAGVRLLPLRWGAYLSEFDPYYHYRVAEYVARNGFASFYTWYDYRSWFPGGRLIWINTPPGLPFTAAFIQLALKALGFEVSVFQVTVFFPVFMGAVTCLALYFFGKDLSGDEVGLLAALILALSPAYIERTYLGFFKHETLGIFLIVLTSILFLRAIRPGSLVKCFLYSIGSGLTLTYFYVSWGAAPYLGWLLSLFMVVLLLLGRYRTEMLVAYSMNIFLSIPLSSLIRGFGLSLGTFVGSHQFTFYSIMVAMVLLEVGKRVKVERERFLIYVGALSAMLVFTLCLYPQGVYSLTGGKFLKAFGPLSPIVSPIVESVAEHLPSIWQSFYFRFSFFTAFSLLGMFFALKRLRDDDVYLILFFLTSLYFASSMVRLILILAPAMALLSAYGVVEVIKHPFRVEMALPKKVERNVRAEIFRVKAILIGIVFLIAFVSIVYSPVGSRGVDFAYSPTTIASSTMPFRYFFPDWLETCGWLKDNTPENAVIMSWWDYGYYITVVGNSTSLADNSTWNVGQIEKIAEAFMSNESRSIEIMKQFNVTHVVVFTTMKLSERWNAIIYYGDEAKWTWMAAIAGKDVDALRDLPSPPQLSLAKELGLPGADDWVVLPKRDTLLTRLMAYGAFRDSKPAVVNPLKPTHLSLVFESSNRLVFVYELKA